VRVVVPLSAPPRHSAEHLLRSVPGCRSVSPAGDRDGDGDGNGLRIVVDVSVAAVRGLWAGTVTETGPGEWHLSGAGEPGRADLALRLDDTGTTLVVEGTVEGPLAHIGSALLAAAVRRLAKDTLAGAAR